MLPLDGVPDPHLPLRRHPAVHLRRHWRRRPLDVDHARQHPRPGRRVPLRRLPLGPLRAPLHRHLGRPVHHPRHDHRLDRPADEHRHRRPGLRRRRRRHQRAHRPGRRLRDGPRLQARQVRRRPRLHHRPLLPERSLRPAHRRLLVVALHRPLRRPLELCRPRHDRWLLLPPAARGSQRIDSARGAEADRCGRRTAQHIRSHPLQYVFLL